MIRNTMRWLLLVQLLLLSACATQHGTPSNTQAIKELESNLAQQFDPHVIGQLADEHYKAYTESNRVSDRDKAITYYREYLVHSPQHAGAKVALYTLLSDQYFAQEESAGKDYEALQALYTESDVIRLSELPSPLTTKALWKLQRARNEADMQSVIRMLGKAISADPQHISAYLLLSRTHDFLDNSRASLATLRQAVRVAPTDARANYVLGEKLMESVYAEHCPINVSRELKEATQAFKKVIKEDPEHIESHEYLYTLFFYQGLTKLQQHEANLIYKAKNDNASKHDLAYTSYLNGDQNKAEKLFKEILQEEENHAYTLKEIAQLYTNSGQWEQADVFWSKLFKHDKKTSFYNYMMHHFVKQQLGEKEAAENILTSASRYIRLDTWQTSLRDYLLADLTEQDLTRRAKNACESMEANFYIAYVAWLNNDRQKARKYFQATLDANIKPFREHLAANHALQQLDATATK